MKIAVVYNMPMEAGNANWESSRDVLQQVQAVESALQDLDIPQVSLPFTRDLGNFFDSVRREGVEGIVNLCESVDEDARLAGHPAAVFELLGLPFTGSGALALMLSTDKLLAKRQMRAAGIRTPDFRTFDGGALAEISDFPLPALIKPQFEDASIGIDQESVVHTKKQLKERLPEFYKRYGPLLLEQYVEGREFNISLFGYPTARVLPMAEIDFSAFPKELHRIVGYRAKWDAEAFEFHNTPRTFPQNLPFSLERNLRRVAAQAFKLFMLRDYGRIDLRVDELGKIYVLEANANPCLSPDAGFIAAAGQCGLGFKDIVREFVGFLGTRLKKDQVKIR